MTGWIKLGVVIMLLIGLALAYAFVRNSGYQAALQDIATQDQRAVSAAEKARLSVKGCRDIGGHWSQVEGKCNEG